MPRKPKAKSSNASYCPLTAKPRLRLASDAQTASIKESYPKGIAQPALRALYAAGYLKLEQLTKTTEQELAALHGMGPKAVRLLREGLHEKGLDFRR